MPVAPPAAPGLAGEVRPIDTAAVEAALRRMARQAEPPWLHAEVARRMAQRLALVRMQPETIVEWWGHTGASAALLQAAYPKARRIVVEPSPALLQRSRADAQRPWWSARRWAGVADEIRLDDPAAGSAQLLWANMMLHAVADPPALLARWQQALAVGGFVMFSCLGPGTLGELRALYRRMGWPAPAAEFVDMHDLGDMLLRAGFADPVMDQEALDLSWEGPEALRAELRSLGANASPARAQGLRTPRWREQLDASLRALRDGQGRIHLGFEVVYGHAFKVAPPRRGDGETTVSLGDMRALLRAGRRRGA